MNVSYLVREISAGESVIAEALGQGANELRAAWQSKKEVTM